MISPTLSQVESEEHVISTTPIVMNFRPTITQFTFNPIPVSDSISSIRIDVSNVNPTNYTYEQRDVITPPLPHSLHSTYLASNSTTTSAAAADAADAIATTAAIAAAVVSTNVDSADVSGISMTPLIHTTYLNSEQRTYLEELQNLIRNENRRLSIQENGARSRFTNDLALHLVSRRIFLPRDYETWCLLRNFVYESSSYFNDNSWICAFYTIIYYRMLLMEEHLNQPACHLRIIYQDGHEMLSNVLSSMDILSHSEVSFIAAVVSAIFRDLNPTHGDAMEYYESNYTAHLHSTLRMFSIILLEIMADFSNGNFYMFNNSNMPPPVSFTFENRRYYGGLHRINRRIERLLRNREGYISDVEAVRQMFKMNEIVEYLQSHGVRLL